MLSGTGWDCWRCPVQTQGLNLADAFLLRVFHGPGWVEYFPDTLPISVDTSSVLYQSDPCCL